MIIDVNSYLGHWPFRNLRNNTAEALSKRAAENGITHMLVSSLDAIFYKDSMRGNLELKSELESFNGETVFLPLAVINPTYTAWEKDLTVCIKDYGFKGIELFPLYHGYSLGHYSEGYNYVSRAAEACNLAYELGGVVRINAGFENFRQRHMLDVKSPPSAEELCDLLNTCKDTVFIICGFLHPNMSRDFREAVLGRKNVFFDTTAMETFLYESLEKEAEIFGEDRVCFGSLSPSQYPEANIVKVGLSGISDKKKLLYENIKDVLKI